MPAKFATAPELIDYDASTAIVAWPRSTHRFTETTGRLTTNVWSICDLTETLAFALTSIYRVRYIRSMASAFTVLAEPSRRAILTLLASGERSVGDLESALNLSQPSVSKHLRVLRDAGFVEATIDAQRRVYRIRPEPLQEVDAWMAPFRRYWSARVDALERHLDRIATPTRTKRQSRKQR
jgi:DNA-binding transcriptional ArsR family regulator